MSYISDDDLIFYEKDGKVLSCGFSIESILMNNNRINKGDKGNMHGGERINSIFENLAVPAGLSYKCINKNNEDKENRSKERKVAISEYYEDDYEKEVIDDALYNKLLKEVEQTDKSKNKTVKKKRGNENDKKKKTVKKKH
jgi:hypothetical protein